MSLEYNHDEVVTTKEVPKTSAKVVKRTYVLNELEAMKKKLSFQQRSPAISIDGEAKNGVTINVLVKTSLFEYTKAKLINALEDDPEVVETKQTVVATATSKHSISPVPKQKIGENSTSRVVLKTISAQIATQNITEVSLYKNTLE